MGSPIRNREQIPYVLRKSVASIPESDDPILLAGLGEEDGWQSLPQPDFPADMAIRGVEGEKEQLAGVDAIGPQKCEPQGFGVY